MVEYKQSPNGLKFSSVYRKPMNVGLVAKICRVSKKTVLNWIYRDALKAFTTLGGHYRVWPGDLNDFIQQAGLDVPFQFVDERRTCFLVVDDDKAYSTLLKEAVCAEFPEADVIMTDDGYEALLLIGERRPRVVFLDLRMPKIDGLQVLELLRQRNTKERSVRTIVLSAYLDPKIREKLAATIADDVWEKGQDITENLHSLKLLLHENGTHKHTSRTFAPAN
jgi:two-component system OmpR family response regulator